MRSAKVAEFRNVILVRRREEIDSNSCGNSFADNFRIQKTKKTFKHRVMIRNAKINEIRKELLVGCISRIQAIRKMQAHKKARRSDRVIKNNGKRKRNCTPIAISIDCVASGIKRRASRLFLKTKKEGT